MARSLFQIAARTTAPRYGAWYDARVAPGAPDASLITLTNALRLLGEYSLEEPLLGTRELARRLSLSTSAAHRLVTTLAAHGFLTRVEDGRYRLGLRLFELASLVPAGLELREVALPHLRQLCHFARETVHLAIRDGAEMVYIEKIEPNQTIRMYSRIGRRGPMHCTGVGKAVLAFEAESVVQSVIDQGLRRFTAHTITQAGLLRTELSHVREQGYALDHEEIEEGLRCVAAPVWTYPHTLAGAISVAGPAQRMTPANVQRLIPSVMDAAERISSEMGYRIDVRSHAELSAAII